MYAGWSYSAYKNKFLPSPASARAGRAGLFIARPSVFRFLHKNTPKNRLSVKRAVVTSPSGKTITFFTGHYYNSPRRAGFHNLADAMQGMGARVNFVTVGYSFISTLRGDYRGKIPGIKENTNRTVVIRPGLTSYVHYTAWHPHTLVLPALDALTSPFMEKYGQGDLGGLLSIIKATDIFVFESMSALFLFKRCQAENPTARYIYRVSDDVRILGSTHPKLVELEREIAPLFQCISIPTAWMEEKFKGLPQLRLDRHGLDKAAYDACADSPYAPGTQNAVFVGINYLDEDFIRTAAAQNPHCCFHIIGPMAAKLPAANVSYLGELPFARTIPYIKFADVGLSALVYKKGFSASFADSLKILQYRYCGLPIVAPDFIDLHRDGVFYYQPGDAASMAQAMKEALNTPKNPLWAQEARSWDEVAQDILGAV